MSEFLKTNGEGEIPDLTTVEGVKEYMLDCQNSEVWNFRCKEVTAANGGEYTSFWFPTIINGDVYAEVRRNPNWVGAR